MVAPEDMRSTSMWRRFWLSGKAFLKRADQIDFEELLAEKLGHALEISYEDWIAVNHYQKIRRADTRWLYQQERGYIESVRGMSLKRTGRAANR